MGKKTSISLLSGECKIYLLEGQIDCKNFDYSIGDVAATDEADFKRVNVFNHHPEIVLFWLLKLYKSTNLILKWWPGHRE
ncbi:unnamed protein product [Prunus armeniaca]|uniref:Uncharacterized protein n=1 Tax=Prunus armeniaca TaxID=36596 RepID=A0A6J5WF93_PRUAR|nr:unnamed protein product [Prunus armeniaca]